MTSSLGRFRDGVNAFFECVTGRSQGEVSTPATPTPSPAPVQEDVVERLRRIVNGHTRYGVLSTEDKQYLHANWRQLPFDERISYEGRLTEDELIAFQFDQGWR